MTPTPEPGPDAMTARNPYAALARKWQALAEVSRPDERAALSLMVADLWKTIDEDGAA
jgi:hypothetical protein